MSPLEIRKINLVKSQTRSLIIPVEELNISVSFIGSGMSVVSKTTDICVEYISSGSSVVVVVVVVVLVVLGRLVFVVDVVLPVVVVVVLSVVVVVVVVVILVVVVVLVVTTGCWTGVLSVIIISVVTSSGRIVVVVVLFFEVRVVASFVTITVTGLRLLRIYTGISARTTITTRETSARLIPISVRFDSAMISVYLKEMIYNYFCIPY